MSAAGYCYDNAFAESAFASLKAELPDAGQPFPSKQAARLAIFDYIETFYNRRRPPYISRLHFPLRLPQNQLHYPRQKPKLTCALPLHFFGGIPESSKTPAWR